MKLSKKILKSNLTQNIICRLAYIYINFVYFFTSWQVEGKSRAEEFANAGKPLIYAFWHGRLLMIAPFHPKGPPIDVVISFHKDGEIIARVMKLFSFGLIRGSSKKGGLGALKQAFQALNEEKKSIAITPDGPRGPRMRIGGNIVEISKQTGIPIMPVTYSISKNKILSSWDKFMLALPFGKGTFIYGEPMFLDGLETKEAEAKLEHALNAITEQADLAMGLTPIEPENRR